MKIRAVEMFEAFLQAMSADDDDDDFGDDSVGEDDDEEEGEGD